MNYIVNPYISGPPVSGEDFYGRQKEIGKILLFKHKLILFLANRRMGKTSICRQIKHECEFNPKYSSYLCIDWDLQGKKDPGKAKRRLFNWANKSTLNKLNWTDLNNCPTCHGVIEKISLFYDNLPDKKTIVLLIDEPDIFLHFAKNKNYDFLTDLKDIFNDLPNLKVVMVSPPRIVDLFTFDEIPCLLDNFEICHLKEMEEQDTKDLIKLVKTSGQLPIPFLQNGNQLIKDIIKVSNCVPFYVQCICSNIFEEFKNRDPSKIIEEMIEQQTFSKFFRSDFKELNTIQKIMALILVNSKEPMKSEAILDEAKNAARENKVFVPTLSEIDGMVSLGVLKKFDSDKYHFSNRLFDRWILRRFDSLWKHTMDKIGVQRKFTHKVLNHKSLKNQDLIELKSEIEAVESVLKSIHKEHKNGSIPSEIYFKKQKSLIKEKSLLIKNLQDHFEAHGIDSLVEILESIKRDADEITINEKLKLAEKQGENRGWGKIIEDKNQKKLANKTQLAFEISFEVAEYLTKTK